MDPLTRGVGPDTLPTGGRPAAAVEGPAAAALAPYDPLAGARGAPRRDGPRETTAPRRDCRDALHQRLGLALGLARAPRTSGSRPRLKASRCFVGGVVSGDSGSEGPRNFAQDQDQ